MKTFIGTKIIKAKPMTRAEYNTLRGWALPADEDGNNEGYLVEYQDGGKPNLAGFNGYVSWSPNDVFDAAYRVIPETDPILLPHQQRVVIEKYLLDEDLSKLRAFLITPIYDKLDADERGRLCAQTNAMTLFSGILADRIAAF